LIWVIHSGVEAVVFALILKTSFFHLFCNVFNQFCANLLGWFGY